MRFVSLFAGVGGFDLGFEQAGWECVGQVEIDKHARSVLDRHWPDVPKHDDVVTAKGWADERGLVGRVDVVCGGFPCQDVSVAGKRAGLAGERTGLFWDALAFATHVQAGWLVLENVPGLLSSNQGRDFGVVLSAMADAGYRHVEWRVLDSQFHGVPQRRRRVFIVGHSGASRGRPVFPEPEGMRGDSAQGHEAGEETAGTVDGGATGGSGIALSLSRQQQPHAAGSQHGDDGNGDPLRPGHGELGGVVWCRDVMGTLGTTFGAKNYSNVQEVSQGSLVVTDARVHEGPQGDE